MMALLSRNGARVHSAAKPSCLIALAVPAVSTAGAPFLKLTRVSTSFLYAENRSRRDGGRSCPGGCC